MIFVEDKENIIHLSYPKCLMCCQAKHEHPVHSSRSTDDETELHPTPPALSVERWCTYLFTFPSCCLYGTSMQTCTFSIFHNHLKFNHFQQNFDIVFKMHVCTSKYFLCLCMTLLNSTFIAKLTNSHTLLCSLITLTSYTYHIAYTTA